MALDKQREEDEDYEYTEEEFFVVATLPAGTISKAQGNNTKCDQGDAQDNNETADNEEETQETTPQRPQYAIIDTDTERPLLEIEGTIYQGTPDELLGTSLLFNIEADSSKGSEGVQAELIGTTSRVIAFHPVKFKKR
ncbi:hypothetical protein GGI25_005390 [Coemansia spiralis]|uniref:Transcription factor TFIIIC triple barrel domain-containing protein n=2 Tax=Coemansia TaxID=4863 RepID=A0A9W8FYN9_9FUNG|nr:hypothetical protein BX070DRAFT_229155 [Coemansia spiralis]KAJ1991226.1 hypothetical protein EDC05_003588 [Coemansia umbellata]KAJ2621196.1 hypothetical protein GGI26_004365 [Coemansia sp. RSA 1358]KAJ2671699.1 hypothetical protein GGI25_005390 [Coemansia spiralis]